LPEGPGVLEEAAFPEKPRSSLVPLRQPALTVITKSSAKVRQTRSTVLGRSKITCDNCQ
jgi:hypothetical protein